MGRKKAFEYVNSRKRLPSKYSIQFDSLVSLFSAYKKASERGEKLSLEELEKVSDISFVYIGEILKKVGLEPMHGARERISPLTEDQVQTIVRVVKETDMTYNDIATFMKLPGPHNIALRPEIKGLRPKHNRNGLGFVGIPGEGTIAIHYTLAFQVYEMQREGYFKFFSKEEIARSLDTRVEAVDKILERKSEYEPKIMKAFDVLFGRKP